MIGSDLRYASLKKLHWYYELLMRDPLAWRSGNLRSPVLQLSFQQGLLAFSEHPLASSDGTEQMTLAVHITFSQPFFFKIHNYGDLVHPEAKEQ